MQTMFSPDNFGMRSPDAPFENAISPNTGQGSRRVNEKIGGSTGGARNMCRSPSQSSSRNSNLILEGCELTQSHQVYSPFVGNNQQNKEVFITKA